MKNIALTVLLFGPAAKVQANVVVMPTIVHVAENGWLLLALLCLLALLLPPVLRHR